MAFTNGRSEGTLKSDGVLLDRVDGVLWDGALAVDDGRGNFDLLPLNRGLQSDVCSLPLLSRFIQRPAAMRGTVVRLLRPSDPYSAQEEGLAYLGVFEDQLDRLGDLGSDTYGLLYDLR